MKCILQKFVADVINRIRVDTSEWTGSASFTSRLEKSKEIAQLILEREEEKNYANDEEGTTLR